MAAVQYGIYCQLQWVTMAINKSMQPDIGRMLLLDLPILKFDKAPAGCMRHTYICIHVAAQRTALEWWQQLTLNTSYYLDTVQEFLSI